MGMWVPLRTKKRATRKAPGCRDTSRQVNKGYIGNAQYGRVKAHFWIFKRHGFAHLVKCLRVSSDPLDTGSIPGIYISPFQKKNTMTLIMRFFLISCYSTHSHKNRWKICFDNFYIFFFLIFWDFKCLYLIKENLHFCYYWTVRRIYIINSFVCCLICYQFIVLNLKNPK
jgi:hypothetical protein